MSNANTNDSSPLRYSHYPERIILELKREITQFHQATAGLDEYEWCIDEMLNEILRHIDELASVEAGIESLGEFMSEHLGLDGPPVAHASTQLAFAVYQQLKLFGVYTPDGRLPYRFDKAWQDNSTPILVRVDLANQ